MLASSSQKQTFLVLFTNVLSAEQFDHSLKIRALNSGYLHISMNNKANPFREGIKTRTLADMSENGERGDPPSANVGKKVGVCKKT